MNVHFFFQKVGIYENILYTIVSVFFAKTDRQAKVLKTNKSNSDLGKLKKGEERLQNVKAKTAMLIFPSEPKSKEECLAQQLNYNRFVETLTDIVVKNTDILETK